MEAGSGLIFGFRNPEILRLIKRRFPMGNKTRFFPFSGTLHRLNRGTNIHTGAEDIQK